MEDRLQEARKVIERIDAEMAGLFTRRMAAAAEIAAYKKEHGLPVVDEEQERRVLERGAALMPDPELRSGYMRFLTGAMDISKEYQRRLTGEDDVVIARGCIARAGELLDLDRRVLIVTDDGVPARYAETVAGQSGAPEIARLEQGEGSKSFPVLERLLSRMLALGFTRDDCVVSVGGGVCGDLAGFAASMYMRGIDFYNIPTTVLSQADASVGGKTAIDLDGIKNAVGAFYQPKRVLIDTETLATLPKRQVTNGLAEAVKTGLILDAALFDIFENGDPEAEIDEVIRRSVAAKRAVVEADERDKGVRRALNFGHTVGHGIESAGGLGLYHGECTALGMIPMCGEKVRQRLIPVLERLGLPTSAELDADRVYEAMLHDKKMSGGYVTVTKVDGIGSFRFEKTAPEELREALRIITKGAVLK